MLTIILIGIVIIVAMKWTASGDKVQETAKRTTQSVSAASHEFVEGVKPVAKQVKTATANAKKALDDAKHQQRIQDILNNPRLLADTLEARMAQQGQLEAPAEEVASE